MGRIDHQSAAEFEAALRPLVAAAVACKGALVLDFSGVDYISSVGLRVLMIAAKQMREHQGRLLVAALQAVVAEIFAISRFDRILTVTATLDDAIASCSPATLAQYRSAGPRAMKGVRFWGTRGSLPVALTAADVRAKLLAALRAARGRPIATEPDLEAILASLPFAVAGTYGGHSSCVQLDTGGPDYFVCDMGSGLRPFGQAATARRNGVAQTFHIFMSHLHWDHIMGLPFFVPAFIPGNRVVIYGSHLELEAALRRQQDKPSFPVDFSIFGAKLEFVHLEPGRTREIAGVAVTSMLQRHAGDSYGYRFESQGKVGRLLDRLRASAGAGRACRTLRQLLPRRRPRHLRRHVLARRCDLGQGRLGPFEQHRRRRAVPDGRSAPPVPVPPRAGVRRRRDRRRPGGNPPSRGNHAQGRRRCRSARPSTGWK